MNNIYTHMQRRQKGPMGKNQNEKACDKGEYFQKMFWRIPVYVKLANFLNSSYSTENQAYDLTDYFLKFLSTVCSKSCEESSKILLWT